MTQIEMLERRLFIRLVLFSAVFVFFITVSSGISHIFNQDTGSNAGRLEVSLKKSSDAGNAPILYKDAKKIKKKFKYGLVSFFNEEVTFVRTDSSGEWVEIVYTDFDFPSFYEIRLTDGVFFDEEAFSRSLNIVVVSRKLAGRLFGTYSVVGNRITINNEKFTIIGVYENESSFLSFPGSKTTERIIIPFTSSDSYVTRPIKTVAVRDERFEDDNFRKYELQQILTEDLAINLNSYKINDFYDSSSTVSQFRYILVFFIGVACIVQIIKALGRFMAKRYESLKKGLQDMYFFELLRYRWLNLTVTILAVAAFAGAVALVVFLIRFKLRIPPEYVPSNNIFDFKFYFNNIKSSMQYDISSYGYIPSEFERCLKNAVSLQGILVPCAAAAFLLVILNARLIRCVQNPLCFIIDGLPIACCVGIASAMAVLFAGGLTFVLPFKELAVFALFTVLYIGNAGTANESQGMAGWLKSPTKNIKIDYTIS